jgi:hypothetical protein
MGDLQLGLLLFEHFNVSEKVSVHAEMAEGATYPLGYTLSCDFFRSPKTQIALSALHLLQGLAPSHYP